MTLYESDNMSWHEGPYLERPPFYGTKENMLVTGTPRILRPPIQLEKYGLKFKAVLK